MSDQWFDIDEGPESHDAHVWLRDGFDLIAAGELFPRMEPCPICLLVYGAGGDETILTEELLPADRRWIFFVACGGCGTRGPWGKTESHGLVQWNVFSHRALTPR